MKYKIEIWQWHDITEIYKSNNIKNILLWYKTEGWHDAYNNGLCCFYVYENGRELSFDEKDDLGFYD